MKKNIVSATAIGITLFTALLLTHYNPVAAGATKVTICHATHSDEVNPYNQISVDDDSIDGISSGNSSADHNRDDHQDGEDIIPPGPWDLDGRNWDEANQAIYNNGCNNPSESTDPSPSVDPSPSTDPSPSAPVTPPQPAESASPTPTPTNNNNDNNNNSSDNSNSSSSNNSNEGQVLGATYGDTGVATDVIINALGSVGGLMTVTGSVLYGQKKRSQK